MHEHAPQSHESLTQEQAKLLDESRVLTEVDALLRHLDWQGCVSESVAHDTKQNMSTALCEASMPYAVTTTHHKVEYRDNERGRRERVITWLGKSAIEVAETGKQFHFSQAAYQRVDVEIAEAVRSQEQIKPGVAQVFISPKMSRKDAPAEVAKAERMHDDDSIRVSCPVLDTNGNVVARKMQSLLVRDIPLSAWVAMLRDENNIFGKAFELEDEESALSVMKLFAQLDLPEDRLPHGPVDLVAAVLPYIKEPTGYTRAQQQLVGFRGGQELFKKEAKAKADEWFTFDLELARSLKRGKATELVYRHIHTRAHQWNTEAQEVINHHAIGNGRYSMTRELAVVLEKSVRWELQSRAAVVVGNERALHGVSEQAKQRIIAAENRVEDMRAAGLSAELIHQAQLALARTVIGQSIRTGGGCAGIIESAFGGGEEGVDGTTDILGGLSELTSPYKTSKAEDKSNWKWKKGVCQVKSCATRPGQTDVGPCSVCRHCQSEFDAGRDPTKSGGGMGLREKATRVYEKLTFASLFLREQAKRKAAKVGAKMLQVAVGNKKP